MERFVPRNSVLHDFCTGRRGSIFPCKSQRVLQGLVFVSHYHGSIFPSCTRAKVADLARIKHDFSVASLGGWFEL